MNELSEVLAVRTEGSKEVPEQIDKLGMLLEELNKCVHALEEQLNPVLRTDLVQQGEEVEMKAQQLVPLANVLRDRCVSTEAIIKRVTNIRRGLQV